MNSEYAKSVISKGRHYCSYIFDYRCHSPAVTDCEEREDGKLLAGNDENENQVNYCPFCGYKAKIQVEINGND